MVVVLVSWGIAFVEYCLAVPANRIGSAVYSPAELKTMQEVITLVVFAGFTALYFNEPLSCDAGCGFRLIALGTMLVFQCQVEWGNRFERREPGAGLRTGPSRSRKQSKVRRLGKDCPLRGPHRRLRRPRSHGPR